MASKKSIRLYPYHTLISRLDRRPKKERRCDKNNLKKKDGHVAKKREKKNRDTAKRARRTTDTKQADRKTKRPRARVKNQAPDISYAARKCRRKFRSSAYSADTMFRTHTHILVLSAH